MTGSSALCAGADEVRATWLTTTGPDYITSGIFTEATMNQLDDIGLNTVYTEVWKNGFTNFPSPTMQAAIGQDRSSFLGSRNLLQETAATAHRRGLIHGAWFEYGFSSQFRGSSDAGPGADNALTNYARSNGWLLEDQNGDVVNASNPFAWMNPAVPEVREFLIDITLEAIRDHDVDIVQFDDRLAWPNEFGYDATTAALYFAETGNSLPSNPNNAAFKQWRQDKVTLFAVELNDAIDAYRPDLHTSVSPSVQGFAQDRFNADWEEWANLDLFDEYVPQVYRDNINSFRRDLPANTAVLANAGVLDKGVIGLRFNGSGADTPIADYTQMIVDVALANGGQLAGHAGFYNKGYDDNEAALTAFYGVDRDSPFFDADHRPAPITGALSGDLTTWTFSVPADEQFRLIARYFNGTWEELDSRLLLTAGQHGFVVPGAINVELLLDQRPIFGDTDFDHDVDLIDLIALQA
ncbi:MAG: family 10 glycosylhydrolase, partial [Planctomycetota bacterium]